MATIFVEAVNKKLGINVFLGIADEMVEEWYLTEANLRAVELGNLGYRNMQHRMEEFYFCDGSPESAQDDVDDKSEGMVSYEASYETSTKADESSSDEEYCYDPYV
jgi:hypothetical protein